MFTDNLNRTRVAVPISDVHEGDTIYISNTDKSVPYYVLQVGAPFILIENTKTHFGSLYRVTDFVYIEK